MGQNRGIIGCRPRKMSAEGINLNMEGWKHLQMVDYEKIPFKCKVCHEYGNFDKYFKKKIQSEEGEITREEWNEVSRRKGNKSTSTQVKSSTKK